MGLGAGEGFFLFWLSFILYFFIFLSKLLIHGLVGLSLCSEQESSCAKAPTKGRGSSPKAFYGANTALEGTVSQISYHLLNSSSSHDPIPLTSKVMCDSIGAAEQGSLPHSSPMGHTGFGVLPQPGLPPWTGVQGICSASAERDWSCQTSEEPSEMLVYFLMGTIWARRGSL